ncbi:MAG: hypothetical protein QGG84_02870, partial [Rhodospirillales bacterium]|nr:hypothetical protein [Rhodospirillales bacterium]
INRVDKDLPILIADDRWIKLAVVNLLSNAVKFLPEGGDITIDGKINGIAMDDSGMKWRLPGLNRSHASIQLKEKAPVSVCR